MTAEIGAFLKEERIATSMTQGELAAKIVSISRVGTITRNAISMIERGKIPFPLNRSTDFMIALGTPKVKFMNIIRKNHPMMAILEDIESALPVPVTVGENTQLFKFEGHDITTISDGRGNPWWIAKEVCGVLGFKNPSDATKYLDEDERTLINNPSGVGGSKTTIINEPGLYSLILRSRKPAAKIFKRWVTHEVLPAIRKTGCYTAKPSAPELPAPISPRDQLILATVDNYLMKGMNACNEEFVDKVRKLTDKVNKLSIENATLKEKADSYDRVFSGRSRFCIRDAARMLGLPMHSFFTFLRNKKYLDKEDLAYSKWVRKGFFIIRTNAKHPLKIVPQQTLITPAGLEYFSDIVAKGKFDLIEKF